MTETMRDIFQWGFRHADPRRTALVDPAQGLRIDFGDLRQRTIRLAAALSQRGLRHGDRVVLMLHNCAQYLEIDIALALAGLVRVPVMFASTDAEFEHYTRHSEARAIFYQKERGERTRALHAAGKLPVSLLICVDGEDPSPALSYEGMIAAASDPPRLEPLAGEDLYGIRYTAGTTGAGKGVVHTHAAWGQAITLPIRTVNIGRYIRPGRETLLTMHPLSHAAGFDIQRYFVCGATNVVLNGIDPVAVFEAISREAVTAAFMVPTGINKLISAPEIDDYDLSPLTTVYYGASPMPQGVLRRAIARLGRIFVQFYGSSETPEFSTILHKHEHDMEATGDGRRLASAGRPALGVRIKIVGPEGTSLPTGESGEICLKSPATMQRYLKNPELTEQRMVDGWFHQGDIGCLDEDGFLYILDRKEDMIITGGFNVYPAEIESCLSRHPDIQEVCVFGIPDDRWGETIKAAVVPAQGAVLDLDQIIAWCMEAMPSYKKPTSIEIVAEIPLSPAGKPLRRVLRQPYWAGKSRQVS